MKEINLNVDLVHVDLGSRTINILLCCCLSYTIDMRFWRFHV